MEQPSHLSCVKQTNESNVLVVGNFITWQKSGRTVPIIPNFHFAAFCDVTPRLMQTVAPDLVLSALLGDDYDAVELARKLAHFGFNGRYRALTNALRNPRMILQEVRAAAPEIDFDLFDIKANFV